MNEIVKTNGAAASFLGFRDKELMAFAGISTAADMAAEIRNIENAKKLLEIADEYHAVAGEYCALEAEAYFRLAELRIPYDVKLGTKKSRVVEFLKEHRDEKEKIVKACRARAVSIFTYKKEEDCIDRMGGDVGALSRAFDRKLEEFRRTGKTVIGTAELLRGMKVTEVDKRIADGMNERLRDKLLGIGAVGIGDGVYAMPSKENVEKAIRMRLESIKADIYALAGLIQTDGRVEVCNYVARELVKYSNEMKEKARGIA